jgi:hypothetical protein
MSIGKPFGLLIGFVNNFQVVTTFTYNTVTHLHNLNNYTPIFSLYRVFSLTESHTSNKAFNSYFTFSQTDLFFFIWWGGT